jgi:hypothetical protein
MKRAVTLILLLAPAVLFAQGIGVGIKAGANFANVDADDVDANAITSFHAGAYVNVNFSEKMGITPEVLWTGLGSEIDNVKFVCNYISVPVMLRYRIIPLISIEAGPQFGFLTSAEMDDVDYKDDMKSTDFGIAAGALVHLPLGFNGGVRYVAGLTDVSDVDNLTIKNRTWQIYLGWTLFGAK